MYTASADKPVSIDFVQLSMGTNRPRYGSVNNKTYQSQELQPITFGGKRVGDVYWLRWLKVYRICQSFMSSMPRQVYICTSQNTKSLPIISQRHLLFQFSFERKQTRRTSTTEAEEIYEPPRKFRKTD
ncbi:hypothetical protein SprV_0200679900 [Sparganum proliferum]